jgi:hypothetical protein
MFFLSECDYFTDTHVFIRAVSNESNIEGIWENWNKQEWSSKEMKNIT